MAEDWLEPTFEGLLISVHLSQLPTPPPFFFSPGMWNIVMLAEYCSQVHLLKVLELLLAIQ